MIHKYRVYFKFFTDYGTYQTDWTEVTEYCHMSSIGTLQMNLDNTEYDVGVYRNPSFTITMRNDAGYFSEVGEATSFFRYSRTNTQVKVTFEAEDHCISGLGSCGYTYASSGPNIIFQGLLSDESMELFLANQTISFPVIGLESLFHQVIVPYGSLTPGMTATNFLYTILNQTRITNLLTVSLSNIAPNLNLAITPITDFEFKTVKETLDKILLVTNSVLYINTNREVIIAPRTASSALQKTFYGQASSLGPEDILDIKSIKNGLSRTFNYWTWDDTAIYAEDSTSIAKYGYRKKALAETFISDANKQVSLNALRTEFGTPKMEFEVNTPLTYEILNLTLCGKVAFDYPTPRIPDSTGLPICGYAVLGTAVIARSMWALTLSPSTYFKIIGRNIDTKKGTVKFKVRAI
jgi:hypothetical protein